MADVTLTTSEELRDKIKILAVQLKKTIRELTDLALENVLKENSNGGI